MSEKAKTGRTGIAALKAGMSRNAEASAKAARDHGRHLVGIASKIENLTKFEGL